MDIAAAGILAHRALKKPDTFADAPPSTPPTPLGPAHHVTIGSLLFGVAIGALAVYLSWSCNTAAGVDTVGKVIYAVFAWIFGFFYLVFYALFRAGRCAA